jgi:hypothetical protein
VSGERVYHGAVRSLSLVFIAIGLLVLVRTLVHGGGPASLGVWLGAAFLAIGAGRLWISARTAK